MNQANVKKWCEALLLSDETDLTRSGARELAEYFRVSEAEARQLCESSLTDSKQEWEAKARRTSEEILDFYDQTRSYIFEHVWWHAIDLESNTVNVEIIDYACQQGAREYLDFGSGVGSNAILAARSGLKVTLADVSGTMLDFARWRLERRGLKADYLYLREQSLPRERFDVVTAMDVMEHLPRPAAEIRRLGAALKIGGLFVFNARPGFDAQRPMHLLPTMYPVYRGLRGSGLRAEISAAAAQIRALDCFVYRRSGEASVVNLGWKLYDSLRYSALAEAGSNLVNRTRKA
jgi:SAM-dependent methyltransferase